MDADASPSPAPVQRSLRAIGTTAIVAVTDPGSAERAETILREELIAIDAACSRFRDDSELCALNRSSGRPVRVSPLLFEAVAVAVDVARRTEGAVDPTVGEAIETLGYDRDFAEMSRSEGSDDGPLVAPTPAPGWWTIELEPRSRIVRVPPGTRIDLGASAKAFVTDRVAYRVANAVATGVLVSIGGDIAVGGPAPAGGWAVGIAADSSTDLGRVDQVVAIERGGIASSSTTVRSWARGGRRVHHIVDPATGDSAAAHWTLVSVSGGSCVEANAASTAAIVWGPDAPRRLSALGLAARLVRHDGHVLTLNGWPDDSLPSTTSATT